ncbi:MAG: transglutaminase-like domain-containing protein [Clostridiales bacterium]|nr:transglutaminase-like domain-containing protein [Clostridiales bacterium]
MKGRIRSGLRLVVCLFLLIALCIPAAADDDEDEFGYMTEEKRQGIYTDLRQAFLAQESEANLGSYILFADSQEVQDELVWIFRQVLCDDPMIFYISEESFRLSVIDLSVYRFVGMLKYTVNGTAAEIAARTGELEEEIRKADTYMRIRSLDKDSDPYDIIRTLYDYIILNIEYDTSLTRANNDNAYGALVERNAVCYGYAKAYLLLLRQYGIQADIVYSNDMEHAWVVVEYEGNWYHADPTWDQQLTKGSQVSYANFLKSDAEFEELGHYNWIANVTCPVSLGDIHSEKSQSQTQKREVPEEAPALGQKSQEEDAGSSTLDRIRVRRFQAESEEDGVLILLPRDVIEKMLDYIQTKSTA